MLPRKLIDDVKFPITTNLIIKNFGHVITQQIAVHRSIQPTFITITT
jgi:hypothetical protein